MDKPQDQSPAAPKKKRGGIERTKQPVTCTRQQAFDVFVSLEQPSLRKCTFKLLEMGHKISHETIRKWASTGNWYGEARAIVTPYEPQINTTLETLKKHGKVVDARAVKGLMALTIVQLSKQVMRIKITAPHDFIDLAKFAKELQTLAHEQAGIDIDAINPERGASGSDRRTNGQAGNGSEAPKAKSILSMDDFKPGKRA